MEIKDYYKGDEVDILQLFKTVYGREMSYEYWKWRFENNPAGKYMIKLMWEGEKLIGHYAVSPVMLSVNRENCLSTLSMTTMTHQDYGGRGIFPQLANALYHQLENELEVKAIWGFPNQNSHYSFLKKLKWQDLGIISHLGLILEKVKAGSHPNIRSFTLFKTAHRNISLKVASGFPVHVYRDEKYLNWRYNDNPTSNYDKFEFIDSENEGYIVVKKFSKPGDNGNFDLFITEIGIEPQKMPLFPLFLSHIKDYYGKQANSINTWLSLFDERHIQLEKLGFSIGGKPTFIGVRPNDDLQKTLSDFRNWYYTYSDSDIY